MKPPSHPQPNLAQQDKGFSDTGFQKEIPSKFYSQISTNN